MDFDTAFARTITHEKGFQNNPKDSGNWTGGKVGDGLLKGTKYGISAAAYPNLDIERLTLADVRPLYLRDYWRKAGCDAAPDFMRFDLFDSAVHSGVSRAVMFLQQAARVQVDGKFGPITDWAVRNADPYRLFSRFNGARLDFLNNNPDKWAEFGRGWAQRIADNLLAV